MIEKINLLCWIFSMEHTFEVAIRKQYSVIIWGPSNREDFYFDNSKRTNIGVVKVNTKILVLDHD